MILGVGTDIVDRNRFPLHQDDNQAFFKRSFTEKEIKQAKEREEREMCYLTTRFAAKEAVFKAISFYVSEFRPGEIEILDDGQGKPEVRLIGITQRECERAGNYRIHVSISYETDFAVAFAVLELKE